MCMTYLNHQKKLPVPIEKCFILGNWKISILSKKGNYFCSWLQSLLILVLFSFYSQLFSKEIAKETLETDPVFLEIKSKLDPNWKVKIKNNILTLERKNPVFVMPYSKSQDNNNYSETENSRLIRIKKYGMKMKPNIVYRYQKRWTVNESIQAEIVKEEIESKIKSLPDKYKIRHLLDNEISNKGIEIFIPKTKLEKSKVKEYFNEKTKLEKKIPKSPDYHLSKFSLFVISKKDVSGDYSEVYPESVLGEFIQVEKLLYKYKVKE